MGRKPIPDKLKLVKGTARADRMNADAPAANPGVAVAPEWLSDRGPAGELNFDKPQQLRFDSGTVESAGFSRRNVHCRGKDRDLRFV